MKNSRAFYVDGNKVPIGDPFILRHNGIYYLYPSTEYPKSGINCFTSSDLVNWTYRGSVCDDPVTLNAYAPEVIYAYNRFYLCTSPGGNGHYIFVSDNPLGPFTRITDNIKNMIDGTFFLDEQHQLRFLRANHNGISMVHLDYEGMPSKRVNINAPLNGWTEGPFMIYKDGFYYLTYCGNHLESKGYRVHYATAKSLDEDFRPSYQPLLISTKDDYCCLGHSSTVLAPDLDGYYLVYHHLFLLEETEKGRRYTRNLCLDRIHLNGRMMSTTPSNYEITDPKMPDLYEDLSVSNDKFEIDYPYVLSKLATKDDFTAEFNFKHNGLSLIFGYTDEINYLIANFTNNEMIISSVKDNKHYNIDKVKLNIDFFHFHCVRLINGNKLEILVDNVPVCSMNKVKGGRIGFFTSSLDGVYYTAFSNHANGSSDLEYPIPLPAILDCKHDLNKNDLVLENDGIYSKTVSEDQIVRFRVISNKRKNYLLSVLVNCNSEATLEITTKNTKKLVKISVTSTEYEFITKNLSFINVDEHDEIQIKVIDGLFTYRAFFANEESDLSTDTLTLTDDKFMITGEENYYLRPSFVVEQSVNFVYDNFNKNSHFGLVFHATNFSVHGGQGDYGFYGYIIGFKNSLMVVDHVNYGLTRVYDVPVNLELNKEYKLRATLNDSLLTVYLNEKLICETTLNFYDVIGSSGVYQNEYARVRLFGYNIVESVKE